MQKNVVLVETSFVFGSSFQCTPHGPGDLYVWTVVEWRYEIGERNCVREGRNKDPTDLEPMDLKRLERSNPNNKNNYGTFA